MKEKFRIEYFRKVTLVLKSKLNGRNKIMTLSTGSVSTIRYSDQIFKWNKNEQEYRNTRTFMTTNKELHPISYVARFYVSRKNDRG